MHFLETLQSKTRIPKNLFKVLLAALTVFLFVGLFYPFFTASKTVEVVKVTDGDTVDVRFDGTTETIRFKGVDTPETEGYNTPEEYKGVSSQNWRCLQKWGYNAKDFVKQKIEGKEVALSYRKGILVVERGDYNRILGKIYVSDSNKSLNRMLVEEGYARSYEDYYADIEDNAQDNSKGLWECTE